MLASAILIVGIWTTVHYINLYEKEKKAREEDNFKNIVLLKKVIDNPAYIEIVKRIYAKHLNGGNNER